MEWCCFSEGRAGSGQSGLGRAGGDGVRVALDDGLLGSGETGDWGEPEEVSSEVIVTMCKWARHSFRSIRAGDDGVWELPDDGLLGSEETD